FTMPLQRKAIPRKVWTMFFGNEMTSINHEIVCWNSTFHVANVRLCAQVAKEGIKSIAAANRHTHFDFNIATPH
ncbi:hypothetical protein, partial [Vibrio anguillarum]